MAEQAIVSPVRRYGLVVVLLFALCAVFYVQLHPYVAPATPLPDLVGGVPIVPDDKLLYHIDLIADADGQHLVIDAPFSHVATAAGKAMTVLGWAVDAQHSRLAGGVAAVIDGKFRTVGTPGGDRPDVARAFNNPAYLRSAFSIAVPAAALPVGKHVFQLFILSADRAEFYKAPKTLTIEAAPPPTAPLSRAADGVQR